MSLRPHERLPHLEALEELRRQLSEARARLREYRRNCNTLRSVLHRCGFEDAAIDSELESAKSESSTSTIK